MYQVHRLVANVKTKLYRDSERRIMIVTRGAAPPPETPCDLTLREVFVRTGS